MSPNARPLPRPFARVARVARVAAITIVALALGACGTPPPPNVVIVTFDTTRADRLGPYGYTLAKTPTIDRLAAEGVRFDDAEATAPITAVSHSSIMTGLLPPAHGVRDNGAFSLSDDAVTLAERFRDAGYETRAFVSAIVLSRRYRLDQGFDGYDDELWNEKDPKLFMIRERPAPQTIDRVLAWFVARDTAPATKKPFFLWVHLFDPHEPHTPPAWTRTIVPTAYDGEIASADRELGRLVDALRAAGELDRTVFVLTADHGESFGEHGEKTHAIFVYRATTRVPLIVRYPERYAAGTVYPGPVRITDIAPTVLNLAGVPGGDTTQGTDLTPFVRGEAPPPDLPQYAESKLAELGFGMAPLYAVRKGGYTYIRAPRPELYDLSADPGETRNLHDDPAQRARVDNLDVELESLFTDSAKRALVSTGDPLSKETLEMLQSLGYLQGAADRQSAGGIDPKDGIHVYNQLEEARHLAQQKRYRAAAKRLRALLEAHPNHFSARSTLGLVEFKQGHLEAAKHEYRQLLAQDPRQFRIHAMLGQIALTEGDLDAAERHARDALQVAPQFVEAIAQLGLIASLRGDDAGAAQWYAKAREVDSTFPPLHRRIGDLLFDAGNYDAALASYREALRRDPKDLRSTLQAAASARRLGDAATAATLLRGAITTHPGSWLPYYNLACLEAVGGRTDDALVLLEDAIDHGLRRPQLLEIDRDWDALRDDARFVALQARLARQDTPRE